MGRTNPTYRDTIRGLEEQWQPYRRALRTRDQPYFDRLFEHARAHADAGGYLNHRLAEVPLLVSVLLEQERRLCELERAVDGGESTGDGGKSIEDGGPTENGRPTDDGKEAEGA